MRVTGLLLLAAVGLIGCDQIETDRSGTNTIQTPPAPDNTAVNKRDAEMNTKTPIDQKETQGDVDLTAKIRQEVLDTKDLSLNARNAKIITADGKVTLRGPVNLEAEKEALDKIARKLAGESNVVNELEVVPASTNTASPSNP